MFMQKFEVHAYAQWLQIILCLGHFITILLIHNTNQDSKWSKREKLSLSTTLIAHGGLECIYQCVISFILFF